MEIIRFKNSNNVFLVDIKKISQNVIQIGFTDLVPDDYLNGFEQLGVYNGVVEGNYLNYTTLYRTYDESPLIIELSCDGSIYVPPVIPEPTPPEPPYVPTLEEIKAQKISELSGICKNMIESGVTVIIDEKEEHFSYSALDDQANIKEIYDSVLESKLPMYYHSTENGCKLYSVIQIVQIYAACALNKTAQETYFNQLREYIKRELNTSEEVENIIYGTELTGQYLETYNNALEQAKKIMATILSDKGINLPIE